MLHATNAARRVRSFGAPAAPAPSSRPGVALPYRSKLALTFRSVSVSQLLRKNGYRKRKALKKKTMGPRNPNRNAQFKKIARLKKQYLKAGLPVISMDTKKKELLGNFYRDGKIDTQETIETNDHDFSSAGAGTVIPHGLYDVGKNKAFVNLNTSHDTSELACDSIAAWWD